MQDENQLITSSKLVQASIATLFHDLENENCQVWQDWFLQAIMQDENQLITNS